MYITVSLHFAYVHLHNVNILPVVLYCQYYTPVLYILYIPIIYTAVHESC